MDRENYYLLLGLEFDPPEVDPAVIGAAIEARQQQWSRERNHPTKSLRAQQYLSMLADIRRVMNDPELRKNEYLAAQKEAYVEIDRNIALLSKKGYIETAEVESLASKYGFSTDAVQKRIAVEIRSRGKDPGDAVQLDTNSVSKIEALLPLVSSDNLYTFLGFKAGPDGSFTAYSCDEIKTAALEKDSKSRKKIKNAENTAACELAGLCAVILGDEKKRRLYDQHMKFSALADIRDSIELAGFSSKEIGPEVADELLRQITARGFSGEEALQFLKNCCRQKGYYLELPGSTTAQPGRMICKACGKDNLAGAAHCARCGLSLTPAPGNPSLLLRREDSGIIPPVFQFKLDPGAVETGPVLVAENSGGGSLDADISSNAAWLEVVDSSSGSPIHRLGEAELPKRLQLRVDPSADRLLRPGVKRTARVLIRYKSRKKLHVQTLTAQLELNREGKSAASAGSAGYALAVGAMLALIFNYYLSMFTIAPVFQILTGYGYLLVVQPPLNYAVSMSALSLLWGFKISGIESGRLVKLLGLAGFAYLFIFSYEVISAGIPAAVMLRYFWMPVFFLGLAPLAVTVWLARRILSVNPGRQFLASLLIPVLIFLLAFYFNPVLAPWPDMGLSVPDNREVGGDLHQGGNETDSSSSVERVPPADSRRMDSSIRRPELEFKGQIEGETVFLVKNTPTKELEVTFSDGVWARVYQDGRLVMERSFEEGENVSLGDSGETSFHLYHPPGAHLKVKINGHHMEELIRFTSPRKIRLVKSD